MLHHDMSQETDNLQLTATRLVHSFSSGECIAFDMAQVLPHAFHPTFKPTWDTEV